MSALLVSTLVGLSVLMSALLRLVPMAVLFGVFLYMGIASIDGIQFFDRLRLFFMPVKHHSQAAYVRRVCMSIDTCQKFLKKKETHELVLILQIWGFNILKKSCFSFSKSLEI